MTEGTKGERTTRAFLSAVRSARLSNGAKINNVWMKEGRVGRLEGGIQATHHPNARASSHQPNVRQPGRPEACRVRHAPPHIPSSLAGDHGGCRTAFCSGGSAVFFPPVEFCLEAIILVALI